MASSWALHGPVLAMSLNTVGSPAVGCDRLPTVGGTVKLRAWAGLLGTASVFRPGSASICTCHYPDPFGKVRLGLGPHTEGSGMVSLEPF